MENTRLFFALLSGFFWYYIFFLSPLLYLSGTSNLTIPLTLFNFVGQWVSDWPLVFAGLVISTIPILALFFSLQKSVMNGFAGGVKG